MYKVIIYDIKFNYYENGPMQTIDSFGLSVQSLEDTTEMIYKVANWIKEKTGKAPWEMSFKHEWM